MGLSKEVCSHAGADWLKFICQRAARDRNVKGSFLFPWKKKRKVLTVSIGPQGNFQTWFFFFFFLNASRHCLYHLFMLWNSLGGPASLHGFGGSRQNAERWEVWDDIVGNSKSKMADEWWWWRSRIYKRQLMSILSALLLGTGGGLGGNKRSLLLRTFCLLFYGGGWIRTRVLRIS